MRARTFVFALVCGTATAALAQDSGYVRFSSPSANACAVACAGDQMCASWSFGTPARSYGQSQNQGQGGGMCTFSGSSTVRTVPGLVSGLPRRDVGMDNVPVASMAPTQSQPQSQLMARTPQSQSYSPAPIGQQQANGSGASGWGVRPAPWLSGGGGVQQSAPTLQQPQQQRGMPQQLREVPPIPSPTPSPSTPSPSTPSMAAPRIEFEPQNQPAPQGYLPPPVQVQMPAPTPQRAYVAPVPAYTPPPVQMAPAPIYAPPTAQVVPQEAQAYRDEVGAASVSAGQASATSVALPTRPRAGRGVPKGRPTAARTLPVQASAVAAATAPVSEVAAPIAAAPARQQTAARPAPGRGTPRAPVRDPSNPESFRGADGMIDAAEMRRAQLNAARDQGTPAYSVQREWEAVAAERQRADDAGEVRVDPLAGTVPVAPPPETRAQRRAREAEEAVIAAEEARDAVRANGGGDSEDAQEGAPPAQARPARRGARGTPRPRQPTQPSQPRQTSMNDGSQQVAAATPQSRRRGARPAPAQALDREPRLSGGPG